MRSFAFCDGLLHNPTRAANAIAYRRLGRCAQVLHELRATLLGGHRQNARPFAPLGVLWPSFTAAVTRPSRDIRHHFVHSIALTPRGYTGVLSWFCCGWVWMPTVDELRLIARCVAAEALSAGQGPFCHHHRVKAD